MSPPLREEGLAFSSSGQASSSPARAPSVQSQGTAGRGVGLGVSGLGMSCHKPAMCKEHCSHPPSRDLLSNSPRPHPAPYVTEKVTAQHYVTHDTPWAAKLSLGCGTLGTSLTFPVWNTWLVTVRASRTRVCKSDDETGVAVTARALSVSPRPLGPVGGRGHVTLLRFLLLFRAWHWLGPAMCAWTVFTK